MKRTLTRLIAAGAMALALTGCGSMPAGEATTAAIAGVTDMLTGPDTDYKNYLAYCAKEVAALKAAAEAENGALKAGLDNKNEKIQFASLVLLAAKNNNSPRVKCGAERKRSFTEMAFENSNIIDLGLRLYEENRESKRFEKKLESDEKRDLARMAHDREMTRRNNDLLTTLSGDKLELQRDARGASTETPSSD